MFQLLLTADVVIADITLHNANVYYELGIRHSLRARTTVLVRGAADREEQPAPDAVPFDLLTDRYVAYPLADPASRVAELTESIRRGIETDRADSPVYRLLPALPAPSREQFLAAPRDFQEELERRHRQGRPGDLALLAAEVEGLPWEVAGLRLIGRRQFQSKHLVAGIRTWELLRGRDPRDAEAHQRLATLYQRTRDRVRSEQAAECALGLPGLSARLRAETHALIGSNAKTRWIEDWENATGEERVDRALRSPWLRRAADAYEAGFRTDLNHYYSGINALGLTIMLEALAAKAPGAWIDLHDDDRAAEAARHAIRERCLRLAGAVELSLEAARQLPDAADGFAQLWVLFTAADLTMLTGDRPARTAQRYREARLSRLSRR